MESSPKYKGVIFDLDQTLANTEDFTLRDQCNQNCEQYAEWHLYKFLEPHLKIISWPQFQKHFSQAKNEVKQLLKGTAASHNRYLYIQRTLENLGLRFSPHLVNDATNVYWDFIIENMSLFPGVEETLRSIKEGHLVTAVLSDLTADIQIRKLAKLGIEEHIDLLVTSEEANADKPDLRPFNLVLSKMGLSNSEVIVVGNNPKTDIDGARNASIDSILFDFNDTYPNFEGDKISDFTKILSMVGITDKGYSDEKLIIFDLIGTLTTEPHLIRKTLLSVLKGMNIGIDYQTTKAAYEDLKVSKITDEEFWNLIGIPRDQHQHFEDLLIDAIILRDQSLSIISDIHRKHKTALLSNIPSSWGRRIVDKYELKQYFDTLIFSGDYKTKKPDPKLYKIVLLEFPKINPSNVFIIDNELGDLKAAQHHIMNTIWLKVEESDAEFVPDDVIPDLSEIQTAL